MVSTELPQNIARVVLDASSLQARIAELGAAIASDHRNACPLVVGILKGSFVFMADLVRAMDIELEVDFVAVSSYGSNTTSSGVVRMLKDLDQSIAGRHVILVEDIVDTGLTLAYLLDNLRTRGPASLSVCCLLDKQQTRKTTVPLRYVGFPCPDDFVVGYGLDFAGLYRNLPFIGALASEHTT